MREKGFTLIEMMVVLLILAISAGILVLQIPPSKNQLEKQQADMLLRSLQSIQSYAFTQNTSIEYRFNPFGYEIKNVDPRFLQLWGLPGSVYSDIPYRSSAPTVVLPKEPATKSFDFALSIGEGAYTYSYENKKGWQYAEQ